MIDKILFNWKNNLHIQIMMKINLMSETDDDAIIKMPSTKLETRIRFRPY